MNEVVIIPKTDIITATRLHVLLDIDFYGLCYGHKPVSAGLFDCHTSETQRHCLGKRQYKQCLGFRIPTKYPKKKIEGKESEMEFTQMRQAEQRMVTHWVNGDGTGYLFSESG